MNKQLRTPARLRRHLPSAAFLSLLIPVTASAQIPDTLMAVRDSLGNTRMTLHSTGGFSLGGTFNGVGSAPPAEGSGVRMMWYPEKAAFRAGSVTGTMWDDANIGNYSLAIGENVRASADNAVVFGKNSTAAQVSSFAMGEDCTASGAASVALGYHAHTNARQGSFVFSDRSSVDTLRAGVNHSANWRVSGGFRIFTASNLSTGVTIQSGASVSNWGQSNAVISTSTGAYLHTNGTWTNTSDVNRKHLFRAISGEDILSRLRALPIQSWSYKVEDGRIRHIGPTAQDFYAAFGLGDDNRTIGTTDAAGVALASAQALEARTNTLSAQLEVLKAENATLRSRLDAIDKPVKDHTATLPLLAVIGVAGAAGAYFLSRRKSAARN